MSLKLLDNIVKSLLRQYTITNAINLIASIGVAPHPISHPAGVRGPIVKKPNAFVLIQTHYMFLHRHCERPTGVRQSCFVNTGLLCRFLPTGRPALLAKTIYLTRLY